jgi:XTP/dITP diphosphohydrolase
MAAPAHKQTVVLASGNTGKLRELEAMLAPLGMTLKPQAQFGMADVEETGLSFVENAIIKARAASRYTGHPAIADDSGLEVDQLNGAPGIYSARYSGAGDAANNALLLQQLGATPEAQRSARFQCVLVYMRHAMDPTPLVCQASWEGIILFEPRGEHGFGYDPLFYIPEHSCSAAQLPADLKNRVSHRAKASAQLFTALRER